jgi:hypothetical protein
MLKFLLHTKAEQTRTFLEHLNSRRLVMWLITGPAKITKLKRKIVNMKYRPKGSHL